MDDFIAKCREASGNNKVTLHGEILVGNSNRTQLLVNDLESKDLLENCVNQLETEFPCLKVEKIASIAEVTIKFFAYKEYTNKDDFLDLLKFKLEEILTNLYACKTLSAQINIFGNFQTTENLVEFRYLNKRDCVEYKIVTTKKLPMINKFLTRKVQLILAAIVILIVLGPIIYSLVVGREVDFVDMLDYIPADHKAI